MGTMSDEDVEAARREVMLPDAEVSRLDAIFLRAAEGTCGNVDARRRRAVAAVAQEAERRGREAAAADARVVAERLRASRDAAAQKVAAWEAGGDESYSFVRSDADLAAAEYDGAIEVLAALTTTPEPR